MKPALPSLVNYLNSNDDVVLVDLYTILLQGGETLRFMDYPLVTLTIPGTNFPGSPLNTGSGNLSFVRGPRVGRSKVSTKVGIEPAEITIEIYPATGTTELEPADLIGTFTWQEYGDAGGFDGAHLELDRLFLPIGGDGVRGPLDLSLGAIVWFYGIVAEVEVSRSKVEIKTKSLINLLQQQQMPRRLFQSGCTHIFGDAMCGYNRVSGQNALGVPTGIGQTVISVVGGSAPSLLIAPTSPASFYTQGTATGQSGQNAGLSRGISNVVGTNVYLAHPFPFPVAAGDQFQLLPGCDHTSTGSNGCTARQNLLRYGGFDYIPPPELAL